MDVIGTIIITVTVVSFILRLQKYADAERVGEQLAIIKEELDLHRQRLKMGMKQLDFEDLNSHSFSCGYGHEGYINNTKCTCPAWWFGYE